MRVLDRERLHDHPAHRQAHDVGAIDAECVEPRDDVVLVKARRPSGRLFDLTIDRCSGEVVDAKPIYGRRYGGFGGGPRRYWAARPYY